MANQFRLSPDTTCFVFQKILKDVLALAGENRFRMELDTVDRPGAVPEPHDVRVLARPRRDLEFRRQTLFSDHERVISRSDERPRDAPEQSLAVVLDRRRLAVHRYARAHHVATEHRADRLVSKADAENRRRLPETADHIHRHAGGLRASRPR